MAVDEALLEAAEAEGQCTLRFYRWEEPTLSLGYFQAYGERRQHAASACCPVVRRASGGGAILHDRELTYSFAVPNRHSLAVGRLQFYQAVHAALIEALAKWKIKAAMYEVSGDTHAEKRACEPFLCFQRRSPGDVVVGRVKIAGSAQRRCRGAVLQHGSVILERSAAAPELDGLAELAGRPLDAVILAEAWLAQLADGLSLAWRVSSLSDSERRRAAVLAAEKYGSPTWTVDRGRGA